MAEQEPLIKPEKGAVPAPQSPGVGPARAWDGHLLACFGNGDLSGWSIFSLVYLCPCVAFGFNVKRAFRQSLLLHAALYFLLIVASGLVMMTANRAELLVCPHGWFDDAALPGPHPHPHPGHRKMLHDGEDGPGGREHHEHHPKTLLNQMLHHPPTPPAWDSLPPECRSAIVAKRAVLWWVTICALTGLVYCALRRTAIREKFGIAGSRLGDLCTWWCCGPCALCQETRTLTSNNVVEGVWHGPSAGAAPPLLLPLTVPPPAQAVTGVPVAKVV